MRWGPAHFHNSQKEKKEKKNAKAASRVRKNPNLPKGNETLCRKLQSLQIFQNFVCVCSCDVNKSSKSHWPKMERSRGKRLVLFFIIGIQRAADMTHKHTCSGDSSPLGDIFPRIKYAKTYWLYWPTNDPRGKARPLDGTATCTADSAEWLLQRINY